MTIRYPNGTSYSANKINKRKKTTHYGRRGMSFEELISRSNETYRARNKAVIYKKPTPIQVVKVDYPKRSRARITEAYYRKSSTTDYNGIYRSHYIDFEAKETKNKTRFPLANFQKHQIEHLRQCQQQGGICFALLSFSTVGRIFVLAADKLCYYWDIHLEEGQAKSIKLNQLETDGIEIHYGLSPAIPYLDAVDQLIENKAVNKQ